MASAREIITRSLRRLRVVSLIEEPASELLSHGLAVFNDMLSAYEADGLTTETVVATGNTTAASRTVTGLTAAANLRNSSSMVVGMEVTGTGVSARIFKIVSDDEIELDAAASASGTGVSLTFEALPMDDSMTEAIVAVLAVRLAEDFGATVGPVLARDAKRGQAQIDGVFFKVPKTQFDAALTGIGRSRYYG